MKYLGKSLVFTAVLSASISSAFSEETASGKLTFETANFTKAGTTTGADNTHASGDSMKQEISARFYLDGDINDNSTYHLELQGYSNSKAVTGNDSSRSYTQREALREAYIDTTYGDWLVRAGKQQVVWGTADGAKLLDMINPTDYTEMAQNQMEDSRIPVFMINAEKDLEEGGNIQLIVAEPRENIFAGLDRDTDTSTRENTFIRDRTYSPAQYVGGVIDNSKTDGFDYPASNDTGHPFKLMGPDSITGDKNGFLNIVPDLGGMASQFSYQFSYNNGTLGQSYTDANGPSVHSGDTVNINGLAINPYMNLFTVAAFTGNTLGASQATFDSMTGGTSSFAPLNFAVTAANMQDAAGNAAPWDIDEPLVANGAVEGSTALAAFASAYDSNLYNPDADKNTAFEYMDRATFKTFDTFGGAKSKYVYKMPSASDTDIAFRYKNTTPSGVNYSLNYAYAYDKNPIINTYWTNDSGAKIFQGVQAVDIVTPDGTINTASITLHDTQADADTASANALNTTTFANVSSSDYGSAAMNDPTVTDKYATLVFEQETKRVHHIGGSFDMAVETDQLGPVVIRGEALYMKDTYSPIMNLGHLSYGNLVDALTMKKGDRFKYVLGADITALTNMMVSVQFIQDINLDYVDNAKDWDGADCAANATNCGEYTTDYPTMHLTNGFQKAEKNKNFYSLYLSKPFGESGQHRWNNILMLEQAGGRWNRFDIEYAVNDNTVATFEWNKYWGENNTQFGQLKNSSNIQAGIKYTF